MGWATGVFGLFIGHPDVLDHPAENYVGVALAVIALAMYTQVRTGEPARPKATSVAAAAASPAGLDARLEARLEAPDVELLNSSFNTTEDDESSRARSGRDKMVGVAMALVAGLLFGNTFTPVNYLHENGLGPTAPLDYIFSHYTGIFATSTFWFVCYCAYMRGSPRINPRITLPGMLSGVMWAIAQTCWFIANDALSVSVSFPIVTSGPGIVSAMWGVFVFSEIRGKRNYVVLCIAIALALTGCILIGHSK